MYKVLFTTLILLFSWLFSEEITIFGDSSEKPRIFLDKGSPRGILIDILIYIEENSDISFNIVLAPWARAYENALAGKGGIIGLSKNEERLKIFNYTEPVYLEKIILAGWAELKKSFKGLDDIKNSRVGITRGGYYGGHFNELRKEGSLQIIEVSSAQQRLHMLVDNRLDWAVIGSGQAGLESIFRDYPRLQKKKKEIFTVSEPLLVDPNYLGFSKKMEADLVVKAINLLLSQKKHQDKLRKIITAWE